MATDRVFDAVACCGGIVILAEPVTIRLLHRLWAFGVPGLRTLGAALAMLAMLAALAVLRGLPVEAVVGPLALYLSDTAWTLQRRIRAGELWLQPHRTHVYQRWCDAGWSQPSVLRWDPRPQGGPG